jgi:hypothetical protein
MSRLEAAAELEGVKKVRGESVAKESTEPSDLSGLVEVVEGVQVKAGWLLPVLRDKRKHAGIRGVCS